MMNAIVAAQSSHTFIYRGWEVTSAGNPYTHAILRGYVDKHGKSHPNYHYEDLVKLNELYLASGLANPTVIVDTNHNNSGKRYLEQIRIANEVVESRRYNNDIKKLVKGLMIESYLEDGAQGVHEHIFGKSITDPCLGWEKTEQLIFDLAEKLNYSDKAVSKWERGESVPDVLTMADMAGKLGTTVNDLLADPNALPEQTGAVQQTMGKVVQKTLKRKANKNIILALSSLLVWFVALFLYVVLSTFDVPNSWLAFFCAVPADAIVMLSLRSAWRDFRWNRILISTIMWGTLLSVYMMLKVIWDFDTWKFFLLGIPGQVAILLWFKMFRKPHNEEEENG